jgi:endo-alpha-1,4-polygalactosaminidase (GH114 family)
MNPVPPVRNTLIRVRRLSVVVLFATLCTALSASAYDGERAGAGGPESFAFAIGNGNLAGGPAEVAARLGGFDLVVVDGELARAEEVAALRDGDSLVLGYLSVGTIERWRSWYPTLKRFRLGAWRDWKDEWFADVSRRKLRSRLSERIAPAILAKGFDGLFLDNVDMVEAGRHRAQRPGMRTLVLTLADLARADGRLLFAQNGHWGLRRLDLFGAIDGWNREDVTSTYDFDRRRYVRTSAAERRAALRELRDVADRGLITTATDYASGGDRDARADSVRNACGAGALPYVGDIGLTARRLPDPPLACP